MAFAKGSCKYREKQHDVVEDKNSIIGVFTSCRGGKIRTCDLLLPKQARWTGLRYAPIIDLLLWFTIILLGKSKSYKYIFLNKLPFFIF